MPSTDEDSRLPNTFISLISYGYTNRFMILPPGKPRGFIPDNSNSTRWGFCALVQAIYLSVDLRCNGNECPNLMFGSGWMQVDSLKAIWLVSSEFVCHFRPWSSDTFRGTCNLESSSYIRAIIVLFLLGRHLSWPVRSKISLIVYTYIALITLLRWAWWREGSAGLLCLWF